MTTDKPTCGPLFEQAWKKATSMTDDPVLLFSAGHICGQAEKIYLGACSAAMFRPTPENNKFVLSLAVYLSSIYGLEVSVFERQEIRDEIWIHSPKITQGIALLRVLVHNSPEWHYFRGVWCGVPDNQIDHEFHLRKGYNQPCDRRD